MFLANTKVRPASLCLQKSNGIKEDSYRKNHVKYLGKWHKLKASSCIKGNFFFAEHFSACAIEYSGVIPNKRPQGWTNRHCHVIGTQQGCILWWQLVSMWLWWCLVNKHKYKWAQGHHFMFQFGDAVPIEFNNPFSDDNPSSWHPAKEFHITVYACVILSIVPEKGFIILLLLLVWRFMTWQKWKRFMPLSP